MKKFLKYIALFSLPLVLIGLIMEIMLRQIPNPHSFKRGLIESKGNEVKNLIIGSSVSNYGIDPSCFEDSTLNLSVNGQWIRFNQALLEKYIDRLPNLKQLVWGFCYQTLWSDDCDELDKGDVVYHCIYWDIYSDNDWLDHIELLSTGAVACKKWSKYYLLKKETMQCDSLGLDRGYPLTDRSRKWREVSVRHAKNHTVKTGDEHAQRFILENLSRIHEVVEMCSQRGINVHLVLFPTSKDYYEHTSSEQLAKIQESFMEVTQRWENVYSYDYFCDKRFVDDDFHDGNHLTSDGGSKKLSKILWHDMQQNLKKQGM